MVLGPSGASALAVGVLLAIDSAAGVMDVGGQHVCATVGMSTKCWGANRWGQLGRGDRNVTGDEPDEMGDNLIPVDLGTGESASSMALGTDHSCVILESGDVKCFGQNDAGQLGLGDSLPRGQLSSELGDNLPAVDFGTGVTATAITAGCEHTCGLLDDGSVKCFGYNNYGQLGQGTKNNMGDDAGEMGDDLMAVPLGTATASVVTAGCDHTCAITDDGAVMCWGRNTWGQLGTGDSEDRLDGTNGDLVAVDLDGSVATAIAAGLGHVCVLTGDSSVKCWGRNNNGQLGLGDDLDRGDTPASLGANLPAVALGAGDVPVGVYCGSYFTCVLLDDGAIKCFGENQHGQLGIGSDTEIGALPFDMGANLTAVDLGGNAAEMATGDVSACAVLGDDSVKCWGLGSSGQLGQGDDENIGDVEGVLAETEAIDLGSDTSGSSIAPTISPLVTMTASPTLALGMTAAPSVSMTPAPTVVGQTLPPGVTLAPGTTMAPAIGSIDTPSPVVGGETTANSAHARFAGGFLATLTLGAALCMSLMHL